MFWNNFVKLCNEKGEKPNPVAQKLHIASGTLTTWKNGRTPSGTSLQKIADYFGVSVDYLLGNTDEIKKESDKKSNSVIRNTLSPQEMALINAYRAQPDIQPAVDRLLGIEQDGQLYVYTAAHSDDKRLDEIIRISKEDWEKIKNTPDTDDTLR